MLRTAKLGAVLGLAILAVGCFETKQDYSLNPDGSGRVTYELTMQDMSAMIGAAMGGAGGAGEAPPQPDIKQSARRSSTSRLASTPGKTSRSRRPRTAGSSSRAPPTSKTSRN